MKGTETIGDQAASLLEHLTILFNTFYSSNLMISNSLNVSTIQPLAGGTGLFVLTRQLLSSSADRMMLPHFFPGIPLEEYKRTTKGLIRSRRAHLPAISSLSLPFPSSP